MFDTTALRAAYDALLDAAVTVADTATAPPPGEWNADQILAHVTLVDATTIGVVAAVTAGSHTVYDTRLTLDPWTIDRAITLAGGSAGLRARISGQADAMCALVGSSLSETELDIPVSTRLLSGTTLLLDRPVPLRDIITGLTEVELPGHTKQLMALLVEPVVVTA
ncbi:hypothetical protein [Nocardia aurea]|uniref:hypothetical protein n=1 Tax=Nocardia aurea TaxID=2144174 RepID=UPI000D697ACA|nr:hypothetical protein [Nocardia aurea]